jgi:hypothetical protein
MKEHVVAHGAKQRQTGNVPIDTTEQAEQARVFADRRFQIRWRNSYPDAGARTQPKPWRKQLPHLAQCGVMYFHHELTYFSRGDS